MGFGSSLKSLAVSTCLEYDIPKTVHIRSRFIGILQRFVQLVIIAYVVGYVFIAHKGYQYIDNGAVSGTTTKIKGVAYTNDLDVRVGEQLWDAADLIVPPEENGAFFITTNIITTHNQTQGECTENAWGTNCTVDSDCEPKGTLLHLAHGSSTGRCDILAGHCIVKAWCPIENDDLPANGSYATLNNTKDWTVMIKNHVHFPYYKKTRSNMIEMIDIHYLRKCVYHHERNPYCPIFRLKDIVSLAETRNATIEYDDKWYETMAIKGGVISIQIQWDCNFDHAEIECKPKYKFARLDNYKGDTLATGYNFRYPIYFNENGIKKRSLVKAYGILFILEVSASARAFDIVTFSRNLGSGIALLGISAVCCDLFLLYIHRRKDYFKKHIYLDLTTELPEDDKLMEIKSKLPQSSTEFTDSERPSDYTLNGTSSYSSSVRAPLADSE